MHLQTLTQPTYILNSSSFLPYSCFIVPFQPVVPYPKCVYDSNFKNGFCSLFKRVPRLLTSSRTHGGLIGIRCESFTDEDRFYMRRCVQLAKTAIGCTSPNPMVGCVIVKDGNIVGEGFHPKAGQPHAEVFALRSAGDSSEDATAYVSLEPCNHYGRTPPCTEALIRAKVKRVVVGMVDPNPIVASKGVERLRESGIDVTVGVEEELCKNLNEAYIHRMLTGKPFTMLRYSLSVNGRILSQLGEGSTQSGGYYSQLLQEYDAVILSSTSFTEKSSFPTSQEPKANQPMKIIVHRNPNLLMQIPTVPPEAASQVIIFTAGDTALNTELAQQGIETVVFDQISLNTILDYCGCQGFCNVLLDIQGDCDDLLELIEDSLEQGLLQKVMMEVFPLWDGSEGSSFLALKNLKRSFRLKKLKSTKVKDSVLIEGYFC
ncbi:PREDICTED: riboflavin biosynthesis protein PYRD, chloroplastic isoform X2 [Nelumbo nucifera]|uniref:Riboflavin biosynthesis protein PYRD, chloroplastic n=1 Tax=Nelumbo nucifera TaxID=4432 RepID=A0A1U7ZQA8_NELNU|nr:PREDICTED: riboflavin biosynthesis protein PYRD, chloroplastic isoform X2 [Nelumbo nucifera]